MISNIFLVENINDIKKLPFEKKTQIAYVTQTTLSVDDTKDIIDAIKLRFSNVIEPKKKDICYATSNRQEAVKEIAKFCDYFLVIGSKNSSNSLRLVEVAKKYGAKNSLLIDDIKNIEFIDFSYFLFGVVCLGRFFVHVWIAKLHYQDKIGRANG